MDSAIDTIIGVILGALASLLVGFQAGRQQLRLEQAKWERVKQDELERLLRSAVAEFTKNMAAGSHLIIWTTWKAKFTPEKLTVVELAQYDRDIGPLLIEIVGSRIAVAALSQNFHKQLEPLVEELYALDVDVGRAIALFTESPTEALQALSDIFEKASAFDSLLIKRISGILGLEQSGNSYLHHSRHGSPKE